MYLKKLTLRGFKSFASATSLVLEPGITCIVGPNGSGKSNVVDALAWVMGEQGAKSLRGASMEDVIFAGTSNRAPLGRAEVQLTIDNVDGALPIDYSEVTISRTKFRNGNSEYAINGTPCRLLDVRELLSDSGIGREMHVIVGQGELDQILQATPETRRGFVEEAAGVLKHRERKEKALRKLEATEVNLNRLTDLISEIRRQLRPLGRQAEVAKRASMVQADLRDAKARILADDLVQAHSVLGEQTADEDGVRARREKAEAELARARVAEDESRAAMAEKDSAYRRIQETWFTLSGIAERVHSIVTLADERVRTAEAMRPPTPNPARDPDTLLAQAESIMAGEAKLKAEIENRAEALTQATASRTKAEADAAEAEKTFQAMQRADSDRREGLARLSGQISSLSARVESGTERLAQLTSGCDASARKADEAGDELSAAQDHAPDIDTSALEAARDQAVADLDRARAEAEAIRAQAQSLTERKAGLTARAEALRLAQGSSQDGASWLAEHNTSVLGRVASMVRVEPGYEKAVAAGLGAAAEAVTLAGLGSSVDAIRGLKADNHGRAGVLVTGATGKVSLPSAPESARYAISLISGDESVVASLSQILGATLVADSIDQAKTLVEKVPGAVVVTRDGDYVSSWLVTGGEDSGQSAIQIASALASAEEELAQVTRDASGKETELTAALSRCDEAQTVVTQATRVLEESAAQASAAQQKLARLAQASALARADADRLGEQRARAQQDLEKDQLGLAQLKERLAQAEAIGEGEAPDPGARDASAEQARKARAAEMEARLGLRTLEERVRSMAGQADSLRKQAMAEKASREDAERRRQMLVRQARVAKSAREAGQWLSARIADSLSLAERDRAGVGQARAHAEANAENSRIRVRDLTAELEALVDSVHKDELARAQQKMRIDALAERAMAEVGLDAETLIGQYGPDQLVPMGVPDEDGVQQTVPFVREEQLKRLRTAERDLQLLGKINPLALEEYDAMQERHKFLSGQLEDVKKTRADLLSIVEDVDARVQEVFASAYTDVEREFASTFARLFPGGEGRLVLTEPGQWLTTGIDVEARPAGKKVKRLSLLSGGERSLVAVCFLVALFKARPSPFYILDEVEAALDDTNLGRLLDIYEELRATSQLLVITHQKRTMEIADTLYGVTMGSDGTSTVVSQRLRED